VESIPAGSKPASIASGEGAIWVGDALDGTVTRIDPGSRRVVKTIGIGAPAIGLATGGGNVWVATGGFGTVVRIDSVLDAVTRRIELGDPGDPVVPTVSSVAFGEGRLWAGAFDGLARLDPDSGEIMRRVDLDQNPAVDIAVGGGAVWATIFSRRAKRVDASSAQVTAEFYTGAFSFAIALDRSAVWMAGADGGQLWKIDPVTGSTLLTSRAGHGSTAVALGSGAVWVASWSDRAIVRVDPATGDVVATIPVGGEAQDVVVRDGLVWAAVAPTPTS
jgi:streptogramin lyase